MYSAKWRGEVNVAVLKWDEITDDCDSKNATEPREHASQLDEK